MTMTIATIRAAFRFLGDRSGVTSIEYALIGGLVSIAIVAGAQALGTQLDAVYRALVAKLGS